MPRRVPPIAVAVVASLLAAACDDHAGDRTAGDAPPGGAAVRAAYEPPADCLRSGGRIVPVAPVDGATPFEQLDWRPGTVFDARGAAWQAHWMGRESARNCFPVLLGASWGRCAPNRLDLYSGEVPIPPLAPPMCFVGGTIVGTQPLTASWRDVKYSSGMAIALNAERPVVEGVRIDNAEDAFVPFRSRDFVIRGNWVSYVRDDCIENDAFASGVVADNLFDGCYVFYSARNSGVDNAPVAPGGGPDGLVVLRDNLIALRNMPGPYKRSKDALGFGAAFKTGDARGPGLALHRNIFLVEKPRDTGYLSFEPRGWRLSACADNVIVWLGGGQYPGRYPEHCFRVTDDPSVWREARRGWVERHPEIARLPGDLP